MNAIELRGITKTFGRTVAVDALDLAIPHGAVYGFIGPNGSGKTTTLRMIMNIIFPDRGEIRLLGAPLSSATKDRLGYLPEERGLYKNMRVRDLLKFYADLKNGKDIDAEIDYWFARLEMAGWAKMKVNELSKGMSQKVQFLATIVARPELLILDEPFSGLDPVNTEALKDAVLEIQRRGTTVLFSTHDMHMAEKLCDFIFMIHEGRKVLDGTLSAIQDRYGSDILRVRTEEGAAALTGLSKIEKINDFGNLQELRVAPGCDPQVVLREILARTKVYGFDIVKPSLEDIFVRIAGPQARPATAAGEQENA
ncbi:MAG: ATP-binding cassette domain-containing protein [Candidatus Eisenbacteria sp.]|nr:ATP-binding cassette domain-containing protein [Candidatus Eisenbacteria bacterium]